MDDRDGIEAYVRELEEALARAGRPTQPLVDEAAAHLLEDAERILRAERCSASEAAQRAIERFGSVDAVVRSARQNAPRLAAAVARVATVVLLVALAGEIVDQFQTGRLGWPLTGQYLIFTFVAELVAVSVLLWRALAGRRAPAWLIPALIAQGAVALALFLGQVAVTVPLARTWPHASVRNVLPLLLPIWLWMTLQSAAGLRALSTIRRGSTSAA